MKTFFQKLFTPKPKPEYVWLETYLGLQKVEVQLSENGTRFVTYLGNDYILKDGGEIKTSRKHDPRYQYVVGWILF